MSLVELGAPSPSQESRLGVVLSGLSLAADKGELSTALRLADRARRLAPNDPTIRLIEARLLLRSGAAARAADRLADLDEPGALALRAESLSALGDLPAAAELVRNLL